MKRTSLAAPLVCALVSFFLASFFFVPTAAARSVRQKKQAARVQFKVAERLRSTLLETPESARSRRDFQKVIEAYRKVYYTAPTSSKADDAVLAVAEMLYDQGHALHDEKSYRDAIGQLLFLRREYPGSRYRVEALFTIAQIYRDDLNDLAQAQATFKDLLKRYPHSKLADQARRDMVEIGDAEVGGNPFKRKWAHKRRTEPEAKVAWVETDPAGPERDKPLASRTKPRPAKTSDDATASESAAEMQLARDVSLNKPAAASPMSRLTSIRHWSTPDYVRVAIDLDQKVKYQAGRVPHPDRIFFDLYGTRLSSDLANRSFPVEAGFLHRIRVAQYKPNMARVVLDVDDVAEYSAFLLPNPYRLIIDVHGKLPVRPTQVASRQKTKSQEDAKPSSAGREEQPQQDEVTVRRITPEKTIHSRKDAASALQSAASEKAGPGKKKPLRSGTTEMARANPPKVIVDEATDTSDTPDTNKATATPTSGPTYQAVEPRHSSRAKKRKHRALADDMPASTSHIASPTANGDRSLIRALGLKIGKIVVDAGHGGHDTGTIGPNGLEEKDLVLDVALRLGKLLQKRLGAEVVYTRHDDTFVPLETRTAIANKEQADLFISIHANSSRDPSARGVETYYLNFTSSRDALEVAARENAVSEKSIHELQDLVKKIALKEKIEESREFATDVQKSLYAGLNARNSGIRNRGVKKAPFIVLIGANMPSILAEISFVSNPRDARKLKKSAYRQRIAESLYKGVARYINGLSGVKVASRTDHGGLGSTAAVAAK